MHTMQGLQGVIQSSLSSKAAKKKNRGLTTKIRGGSNAMLLLQRSKTRHNLYECGFCKKQCVVIKSNTLTKQIFKTPTCFEDT